MKQEYVYTSEDNKEYAEMLIEAIKEFALKPNNLDNFEDYLSRHLDIWLEKYANTPHGLISELKMFADMENC